MDMMAGWPQKKGRQGHCGNEKGRGRQHQAQAMVQRVTKATRYAVADVASQDTLLSVRHDSEDLGTWRLVSTPHKGTGMVQG